MKKSTINFSAAIRLTVCASILLLMSGALSYGASTWTGAGDGLFWDDATNWNSGVPTSTVDAIIPDVVGGMMGVGGVSPGDDASAKSITVQNASSAFSIIAAGTEKLNLSGNFTNDSINEVSIDLDTNFLANSVLDGPLKFTAIANVDLRDLTVSGNVSFTSNVVLQLNSLASYGSYALSSGAVLDLTGATVSFGASSYVGANGDTFQLFNISAGSWAGVTGSTLNTASLPVLTGLTWDTSNFTTTGAISVTIPEPSTWLLVAGGLTTVMVFRRRKSA